MSPRDIERVVSMPMDEFQVRRLVQKKSKIFSLGLCTSEKLNGGSNEHTS